MSTTKPKVFKSEVDVKREIKRLLALHNWVCWMPPANGFGKVGIADIEALGPTNGKEGGCGVYLAIEAKFGNNKPTAQQRKFLNDVLHAGGFAMVVNEKTIAWLAVWLQAFDASRHAREEEKEVKPEDGAAMLNAMRALTVELA